MKLLRLLFLQTKDGSSLQMLVMTHYSSSGTLKSIQPLPQLQLKHYNLFTTLQARNLSFLPQIQNTSSLLESVNKKTKIIDIKIHLKQFVYSLGPILQPHSLNSPSPANLNPKSPPATIPSQNS